MARAKAGKQTIIISAGVLLIWAIYALATGKVTRTYLIVIAIVAPLVVIYAIVALKIQGRSAGERNTALRKNALLMGFSFSRDPDESLLTSLMPGFELFTRGEGWSEFMNYMEGQAGGHDAVVFDYAYRQRKSSGENVYYKTIRHTVCILNQDNRDLPEFQLKSKGVMDKVRDTVGLKDIDPGNDPEFAKRCWLTGTDEEAVRKLFTPAVTRAFRDGSALRDIVIEGSGSKLMYCQIGLIPPQELTDFIRKAGEVSRLFAQN